MELLWKKVRVYEHYGDAERNLRHKAVDELNKIKEKMQDGEGEISTNPNKEWRTLWQERDGKRSIESGWVDKEEIPKIMMMRAQPLEELARRSKSH